MSNTDVIERLRSANPVPVEMAGLPIESVLKRLDHELPLHGPSRRHRARRLLAAASIAVAVAVALAIGGVILMSVRHSPSQVPNSRPRLALRTPQIAVLGRPQTAKDRTMPALVRQADRLGHLSASHTNSVLRNVIPARTRYIETLPDHREVFLAVLGNRYLLPHGPQRLRGVLQPQWLRAQRGYLNLRLIIVQPSGKWSEGPPVIAPGLGSVNNRIAYMEAVSLGAGCAITTYWNIAPNNITRVRWALPRQDRYGYVYKSPMTIDIPVRNNVFVTTIPGRAPCQRPLAVTLYNASGKVVAKAGSPRNLNRITRPIRHGNPLLGVTRFEHKP